MKAVTLTTHPSLDITDIFTVPHGSYDVAIMMFLNCTAMTAQHFSCLATSMLRVS